MRFGGSESRYLYFVEDFGDYHVGGEVVGFCLVAQADAVTEHVVAHRYYVFGYYISALVQESICAAALASDIDARGDAPNEM